MEQSQDRCKGFGQRYHKELHVRCIRYAAGHKCDKESDSSALADGAHRILSISGASGTELTMTDNTFKGLDKCDASSAVLISGITGSGLSVKGNTADTLSKVSIGANGSTSGFTKK